MKLDILLTTMNKNNEEIMNLIHSLNIKSSVIVGNQCNENKEYLLDKELGFPCKVICSTDRGVSNNRNNLIKYSNADLILFADDDQVFTDGYYETIINSFNKANDIEAIYFSIEVIDKVRNVSSFPEGFVKASFKDVSPYGVWGLVIKRSIVIKNNLYFDNRFGSGGTYPTGEDSIYLKDLFDKKINLYRDDLLISTIKQDSSTWFKGFDDKYFISQGACLTRLWHNKTFIAFIKCSLWHKINKGIPFRYSLSNLKKGKKEFNNGK